MEKIMGDDENGKSTKIRQLPGFQGNIYQSKLLMLYLQRGLKNNQNFKLGTEIKAAHKFDDLVYNYKKVVEEKEKDHFIIIQTKHKTAEDPKITYQDIFTYSNGDFGLWKYFNAFKNAKNEKLFEDGVIEHAIIYTNARFDMFGKIPEKKLGKLKDINNITKRIEEDQDDGLSICKVKRGKYYRFKIDLVLPVFKRLFTVYHIIAQKLIDVLTNKNKYLTPEDEILKHYDILLVTEVIDVNAKKLKTEFINEVGNDTGRQKLRNALNKVTEYNELNLTEIIGNNLNITENFGKSNKQQNWPEDMVDADVEEFLKRLVFATEQPNEDKLRNTILCELGDQCIGYDADLIYSNLATEIQNWMTGGSFGHNTFKDSTKFRFISFRDAENVFKTIKARLNSHMLKGPTTKYDSYFEKNDIEFDDIYIHNSVEVFLSSNTRILSIVSKHIIMSSIKLYKELTKTNELNESIYVRLSSLNKNIIDAFEIESINYLIVIELDLENTKSDGWMKSISEIIDIIQRINKKRLIIISNKKNVLESILPADLKIVEINDDENTLKNLTEGSQKHFLNTDIKFQGFSVKLNDLIVNDDLKRLIKGEMLLEILENKSVEIGQELEEFKDGINDYIDRTFTCEIKRNENMYLICGINESDFYSENKNINIIEKPESITENESNIFEHASKENKSMNTYILRKTVDTLILLRKSNAAFQKSNFLDDIYCKCEMRLISAVAGMGKSSLFTHLSKKFKEQNPTFCVIKINLNSVLSELNKLKVEDIKFEEVFNFLHHESELDRAIFEHCLQTGRVMLYLDAFDEIPDDNKKIVLKIIKTLRENTKISKIWMNTRPNDSIFQELKDSINDTPLKHFNIEPFTQNDQKKYLEKSWKDLNKFNNNRFKTCIEELFELLNETINDQQYEFLGIALHTKMISVALKDNFNIFLKSNSTIDEQRQNFTDTLQLSTLYEKFVKEKFKIYWEDKNKMKYDTVLAKKMFKTQYEDFVNQSIILAIDSLFNEELLEMFLSKEDIKKLEEYKNEMKEYGDLRGIVNKIIDHKPHFVHRTFAEYFTADFILKVLRKEDEKSLNIVKYFLENMVNHKNVVVCFLLNDMFNDDNLKQNSNYQKIIKDLSGKVIYIAIKNNWQKIAIWLLQNGIKMDYNSFDGNVLHLTCSLQNSNKLMRVMLEKLKTEKKFIELIKEVDYWNGYTCLNIVVKNGRLDSVKCMLNAYEEKKILDKAFMDKNRNCENIFHLSAYETCNDDTFIYLFHMANVDPVKLKTYFIQTDNKGGTPLKVAACHGQLNKLKAILESNNDSEIKDTVFDNENSESQNVFHLVADKYHDDDTFIYLFNLVRGDPILLKTYFFKRDNKGDTPLKVAASDGQLNKLKAILESNVNSEIKDTVFDNENSEGQNVFHLAAKRFCDYDTFIYLINLVRGDPVKLKQYFIKKDNNGDTPLKVAACHGQLDKLKAILESNDDSEIKDTVFNNENSESQNVFHLVADKYHDYDTFIYLFDLARGDPVKLKTYFIKKDNKGDTPLKVAAHHGQLNKLKAVLESNVDLEIKDSVFDDENSEGQNVFHLVANRLCGYDTFIFLFNLVRGDPGILKTYFIKRDNKGDTPLKVAACDGQLNKLKAILESNVDSEIKDSVFCNENSEGQNVFHLLADKYHDEDIFIYLFNLARGDPVKLKTYFIKRDNKGDTPLKVAACHGQLNKLKAILESNNDSEIKNTVFDNENSEGQNVFHLVANRLCGYDTFIYLFNLVRGDPILLKTYFIKRDNKGDTPLKVAASDGQLNKLKAILESNVNSEIKDTVFDNENSEGQNVFHLVANRLCGYDTFIYLFNLVRGDLVKLKKYFIKTDDKSDTPLKVAVRHGQLNKLKAVLESNVDSVIKDSVFNNENQKGQNVFHLLASNYWDDESDIVDESDWSDDSDWSHDTFICLFDLANGDPEKLKKYFIKKYNKGDTPLKVAAPGGKSNKLKPVLKSFEYSEIKDTVFDNENSEGQNVFHLVANKYHDDDIFIYLFNLARGDPEKLKQYFNKTDNNGDTPLKIAARHGQLNMLKAVLESNVDLEIKDSVFDNANRKGQNVFHLVASNLCDYNTFIYLFDLADGDTEKLKQFFNKTDNKGDTPLKVAARYRQLNKLMAVLESNVDSEIKDSIFNNENRKGQNVFHLVASNVSDYNTFIYLFNLARGDREKLKQYFIEINNKGDTPLKVAAHHGQLNKLKAVLESNVDLEIKDSVFDNENRKGQNVFHLVASNLCDYNTFIYLFNLASGDPEKLKQFFNKTDINGDTPLKVAARYGQLNKLKAVLESNVDLVIKDSVFDNENSEGQNVFHLLADKYHDDDTFINLFNLAGSDPEKLKQYFNKTDNKGDTLLKVAGDS